MCKVCRTYEKAEDSVGKIYNGVKVLEITGKDSHSRALARCLCPICGKEWVTSLYNIKSGRTRGCGCCLKKPEYSVGKIYNGVKVLEIVGKDAYGRARAKCLCPICGKEWVTSLNAIKTGNTRGCGCFKITAEESVGKIYNGVKVLEIVGRDAIGHARVKCLCPICGKEWVTNLRSVGSGYTKSCGCSRLKPEYSVGKIYNGIKVLEIVGRNSSRAVRAKCLCPFCGKEWVTILSRIRNGVVRSCGCSKKEHSKVN